VERVAQIIGLEHHGTFSLFESREEDEYVLLEDSQYIADVLSESDAGRLVFRKRVFRDSDEDVAEEQFLNLSFAQIQRDYLRGNYPVVYEDAAQLCALQLFSEFGSQLPGDEKLLKRSIDRFTVREVKRAVGREEWRADVLHKCALLRGMAAPDARFAFVSVIGSLPYGSSMFFAVGRLADPIGLLPLKVVIGVNRTGIHFFRPIPKEYLHSAELGDLMQFGSSLKVVFFKMRVAGVLRVFQFETEQGEDICMAIQTYINDAMVKRFAPAAAKRLEEKTRQRCPEDLPAEIDEATVEQQNLEELNLRHARQTNRDLVELGGVRRRARELRIAKERMAGTRLRWETRWTD